MSSNFINTAITTILNTQVSKPESHPSRTPTFPKIGASFQGEEYTTCRRKILTTFITTSMAFGMSQMKIQEAMAQNWGVRSFIKERFFEEGLSPEDAVARIKQTAEGLHSIRDMLESMAWRYVIFYIRLKTAYLSQDLKNAMTLLPQARRKDYVKAANELVDNMAEVFMLTMLLLYIIPIFIYGLN